MNCIQSQADAQSLKLCWHFAICLCCQAGMSNRRIRVKSAMDSPGDTGKRSRMNLAAPVGSPVDSPAADRPRQAAVSLVLA